MELSNKSINKILLINLAFIGDVILSTPVARALRERYPAAQIDFMTIPLSADIARLNPYINNVIAYDKRGKHRQLGALWQLIRYLRSQKYDLAISTNFAPRGAMLAWVSGIPYRVGYRAQHGEWFLTHVASAERSAVKHEAENQLDVLKPLGISTKDASLVLRLDKTDEDQVAAKVKKTEGKPLVIICPYGSYWKKSWTTDGYIALVKELSQYADCCLIGGPGEREQLENINEQTGNKAQVFGGTLTLGQLSALISIAALLITVDTGPLHIAQAVGTPVLALFGPTDPKGWGPRGGDCAVIYHPSPCSPCWGKGDCPDHICMMAIATDEVTGLARQMLKEGEEHVNNGTHSRQE